MSTDMVGLWVCGNCMEPVPIEKTDQTRCQFCGLQMEEIRAAQPALTGIERMEREKG